MAIEAETHAKGFGARRQRHPVYSAVALDAADSAVDMDRVIEVDVVRQLRDPLPADRSPAGKACAHRREHAGLVPQLRVAGHADVRARQPRIGRSLDAGMAIATINALIGDVVLVAERDLLVPHPADFGDVARSGVVECARAESEKGDGEKDKG